MDNERMTLNKTFKTEDTNSNVGVG